MQGRRGRGSLAWVAVALLAGACAPTGGEATSAAGAAGGAVAQAEAGRSPGGQATTATARRVPPASSVPLDRNLRAAFLVVDGVYNSELMAPYDVLEHTRYHHDPYIEAFTVSPTGGTVTTAEGLRLQPHHGFDDAPPVDILVVPSAVGSMDADLRDERMLSWVRKVGGDAHYVMSLCDGAFVLAAAGLLEGRAVTTFPGDQDRFAATFPRLDLRRGVSFVHDGPVLTSEGGARSYEVAMYLVDHLYGEAAARGIGGGLLIDWPPPAMRALVVPPDDARAEHRLP